MKKPSMALPFAFLLAVLLLAACGMPGESIPEVITACEGQQMIGLNWIPVNPPHPGLRCWVAWWEDSDGSALGYGISYCEELP